MKFSRRASVAVATIAIALFVPAIGPFAGGVAGAAVQPDAPVVTATGGNTTVALTWPVPAAGSGPISYYFIYRSTSPGAEAYVGYSTSPSYSDTGRTNGTTYYYKVSANNVYGEGPKSAEVSATPAALPGAPVVTASGSNASTHLSWPVPSNGGGTITSYKIYRSATTGTETLLTSTSFPSFDDSGLSNGATYFYKVSAVNGTGEGPLSAEVSATPATVAAAPVVTATPGDHTVHLAWPLPSNNGSVITSYKIYRSDVSGGETFLASTNPASYDDNVVVNGTAYFYKVSAINGAGEGPLSAEVTATPAVPPITAPSAPVLAGTAGDTATHLTWNAPAANGSAILNYKVYRGTSTGTESFLTTTTNLFLDETSLTNGTTYFYVVTAVNGIGEGAVSNEVSLTPTAAPSGPQPGAPVVTATRGNTSVHLSWPVPFSGSAGISSYTIYRSTSSGAETLLAANNFTTTFDNTGLTNGTTYYYQVSASNAYGEGPRSTEIAVTPATTPAAPVVTIARGNGNIQISWPVPANNGATITLYNIYRSTSTGSEVFLASTASTLFADSPLTNGQPYFYKVSAVNGVGEGALSTEVTATPAAAPTAPVIVATPGDQVVHLQWAAPANNGAPITQYNIYRGTATNTEVLFGSTANTSFDNIGITNGVQYFYKVTAVNAAAESALSNEVFATPGGTPLATTLAATPGNNTVSLSWPAATPNGAAVSNYKIYRGTSSGNEIFLANAGNVLSYNDNTAVNGTTYFYKVSAVNANGEGALSNEVSARPAAVPAAPVLSAGAGNTIVQLSWTVPANNGSPITGYRIYRSTTTNTEIFINTSAVTSFTDTGRTNGTQYFYKVTALNAVGEGPLSNEATATPSTVTAPAAPVISATAGNNTVGLSWVAPANNGSAIVNYKIYRSTTSGAEVFIANAGNVLSYNDNTAANGTTYFYKVTAVNGAAPPESLLSNEVSATPSLPVGPQPGQPVVTATPGNGTVHLSWPVPPAGASPASYYYVYRSTTPGNETFLAFTFGTTYDDNAVTNGTTYYYKVSASNGYGEGPKSTEVSVIPSASAGAPVVTITTTSTATHLSWPLPVNGGSPITSYKIYRSTTAGNEVFIATVLAPTLIYDDLGLTNGITYFYKVSAVNANGEGPKSAEVSATPSTVPDAPTSLTGTPGNNVIDLAWAPPANNGGSPITMYKIYEGTVSNGETFLTSTTSASFHVNALTNGTTYYFKVSAVNAAGEGPLSSPELAKAPGAVPAAPVVTPSHTSSSITITWPVPANNGSAITDYKVYRGTVSGGEAFVTLTGNTLTYSDIILPPGTTFYYKVTAINGNGESAFSTEVVQTASGAPGTPVVTATAGNGTVHLSWPAANNNGSPITAYRIYRSLTPGTEVLVNAAVGLTYDDFGLTNTQIYYYKVSAVNGDGEGLKSTEVSATPQAVAPNAPVISVSAGNATVHLSWAAPANGGAPITNYRIYKSTSTNTEVPLITIGNVLVYDDNAVSNGTTYFYKVTAINSAALEGPQSNEVSATPALPVPVGPQPGAPVLTATPGSHTVHLSWPVPPAGSGPISFYFIYRSTSPGTEVFLGFSFTNSYDDSTANSGTTYYYKVTANNGYGESPRSNEATATPT